MKFISKQFIHDKVALLLASINLFLVIVWSIIMTLRLTGNKGVSDYFIEYRSVAGGLAEYKQGGIIDVLSFVLFMWAVFIISSLLAARSYDIKRQLALFFLGFGIMVTFMAVVVSNALLMLH